MEDEKEGNYLTTIESIIEFITSSTSIKKISKIDGITMECDIPSRKTYDKCVEEIKALRDTINLPDNQKQMSFELSDDKKQFALQFPELQPFYTQDQVRLMYTNIFRLLIEEALKRAEIQHITITREILESGKEVYTTRGINFYYRSNCNRYKTTLESLSQDVLYRHKVSDIFYEVAREIEKEYNLK